MLKLISILLTNGIVLFMLISCHNKTGNSKSTVNLEYENSIDSLNSYKMDISHFINSIEPGETIVEEKQMQGKEFITRENENIKVRFLLKAPCSKDGFLKTEIINNTNDTIIYISNTFLHYRESNNSWIPLVYPDTLPVFRCFFVKSFPFPDATGTDQEIQAGGRQGRGCINIFYLHPTSCG